MKTCAARKYDVHIMVVKERLVASHMVFSVISREAGTDHVENDPT